MVPGSPPRARAAPGASAGLLELVRDALRLAFHLGPQHSLGAHHPATGSESQREVGEFAGVIYLARGFCSPTLASQVPGVL